MRETSWHVSKYILPSGISTGHDLPLHAKFSLKGRRVGEIRNDVVLSPFLRKKTFVRGMSPGEPSAESVLTQTLRVTELAPTACAHGASGRGAAERSSRAGNGRSCTMRPAQQQTQE